MTVTLDTRRLERNYHQVAGRTPANPWQSAPTASQQLSLQRGEILLQTRSHSAWGGAVTAQMYLPTARSENWLQLTNYPRWVQYFPDLSHSQVLSPATEHQPYIRLHQVASKHLLMFSVQVEINLKVIETVQPTHHQIQFHLERGNFHDFAATLTLEDCPWEARGGGTLLTYDVQATPNFPVPSQLIQEAMRLDLPTNMRSMRRVLGA